MRQGVPRDRRIAAAFRVMRRRIGRDARVQGLSLLHRAVQCTECFLQRRVGIHAVRIEDVDVIEPHPLQALIEAGEHVFP